MPGYGRPAGEKQHHHRTIISIRGASPLGLPDTRSRAALRRRAPLAWLTRGRSLASPVFVYRARLGFMKELLVSCPALQ